MHLKYNWVPHSPSRDTLRLRMWRVCCENVLRCSPSHAVLALTFPPKQGGGGARHPALGMEEDRSFSGPFSVLLNTVVYVALWRVPSSPGFTRLTSTGTLVVHFLPSGLRGEPPQPFMHCGVTGQALRDSFCVTFICRKMSSSIQEGHIFLFKFHTEKSLTRVVTDSSGSQWVWELTSESLGHGKLLSHTSASLLPLGTHQSCWKL